MNKMVCLGLALAIIVLVALSGEIVWLGNNYAMSKVRVACVGDSITEGSLYPYDLSKLLGENYTVGNFGVGYAAVNSQSNKPYINQSVFFKAQDYQPQIVIILLGTNDANPENKKFMDTFTRDYKTLIAAFEALSTHPKIYIALPPPIFNDALGPYNPQLTQSVIPKIRQVANDTGLPVIDLNSALAGHPEYFLDGVHPNAEGSQAIAALIYDAIK
jgi:lysophospholipase L1-like esterase